MTDMSNDFPQFESEDEMREWFDTADLTNYRLDKALEVVVAHHVELSHDAVDSDSGTAGQTGTAELLVHG